MIINPITVIKSLKVLKPLCTVSAGIDPDLDRFRDILRGKAREELKKFKNPGEMAAIKGGKLVSVPVPRIDLPRFQRGGIGKGGVGSGEGEEGQVIGFDQDGKPVEGKGGDEEGHHIEDMWQVEISRAEIAKLLIEELGLPNLEPKGSENIKELDIKWNTVSRTGKEIDVKRTLVNALKRTCQEAGEDIDPDTIPDSLVLEKSDLVYRSWQITEKPQANAVIIYMIDVSGSMGEEQKEMARTINWYLSTIIQYQFGKARADIRNETFTDDNFGEGVEEVFIIHDSVAREVSEHDFYHTRESGGTMISSAYKLAEQIIKQRYDPANWNIYIFHCSDGDNWEGGDTKIAIETMNNLLPMINEFGYIQTTSNYGSGDFIDAVGNEFGDMHIKVRTTKIDKIDGENFRQATIDLLGEKELKEAH